MNRENSVGDLKRRQPRLGDSGEWSARCPDSQDFAAVSSVRSGSAAAPTRAEGGDGSTVVLENRELAA